MTAPVALVAAWREALEQPGAAARLAMLLLESDATPGVLALEVICGQGERAA